MNPLGDPGIPSYNDAREAYGLRRAASFDDVTHLGHVKEKLEEIYGGNISRMDALSGALAEGNQESPNFVFGDLLKVTCGVMQRTKHAALLLNTALLVTHLALAWPPCYRLLRLSNRALLWQTAMAFYFLYAGGEMRFL